MPVATENGGIPQPPEEQEEEEFELPREQVRFYCYCIMMTGLFALTIAASIFHAMRDAHK